MKVLVAYATFAGSTEEVARRVATVLAGTEAEAETTPRPLVVDLKPANEVTAVEQYGAVVVGSAIRYGKVHPQAAGFLTRFSGVLANRRVAHFVVCLTMKDDTEENRHTVQGYVDAAYDGVAGVKPFSVGLFAGVFDPARLGFLLRMLLKGMKAEAGDYRDWDAIDGWATALRGQLLQRPAAR